MFSQLIREVTVAADPGLRTAIDNVQNIYSHAEFSADVIAQLEQLDLG